MGSIRSRSTTKLALVNRDGEVAHVSVDPDDEPMFVVLGASADGRGVFVQKSYEVRIGLAGGVRLEPVGYHDRRLDVLRGRAL